MRNRLGIAIAGARTGRIASCSTSPRWLASSPMRERDRNACSGPAPAPRIRRLADILYVEALAAPDTINTMPEKTLRAFADHGAAKARCQRTAATATPCSRVAEAAASMSTRSPARLQEEGARRSSSRGTRSWTDRVKERAALGEGRQRVTRITMDAATGLSARSSPDRAPAVARAQQHLAKSKGSICASCSRTIRRGERFAAEAAGLYLDYSKNRITDETLRLLLQLARPGLRGRIERMFRGEKINVTENRAVLHVALRAPRSEPIVVDGQDVVPDVHAVLDQMADFCEPRAQRRLDGLHRQAHPQRRQHRHRRLGPRPGDGLRGAAHYSERDMTFRFVSNVDGTDFAEAVRDLDPAETLFIVASKTFTTLETMTNARTARAWSWRARGDEARRQKHFVAVSTNEARGGRSSASTPPTCSSSGTGSAAAIRWCSAIGLSTMLAIGPDTFAHCSPASIRWTSTSAPRRSSEPAGAHGPARRLVHRISSARRRSRCCPTTSTSSASRPTCSS